MAIQISFAKQLETMFYIFCSSVIQLFLGLAWEFKQNKINVYGIF